MAKGRASNIDREIGARVRLRRQALGLSQADLAERLGVSFQQVQKYESGATRIAAAHILEMAEALDCHVTVLLGVDGPTSGESPLPFGLLLLPGALELLSLYGASSDAARDALLTAGRAFTRRYGRDEP